MRATKLGIREEWGALLGVILAGSLVAAVARFGYDYPWCVTGNDERFWATILEARTNGVFYPISGPLFVWSLSWLVPLSHLTWSEAVSWAGLASVPLLLGFAFDFYRSTLDRTQVWSVLAALATTSYFWTPLIESKPQQWGQWGLLLAAWLLVGALSGTTRWWVFSLAATAVAALHILSFGILVAIAGWVWLVLFVLQQTNTRKAGAALLALAPGFALILNPAGPYDIAVDVVLHHHIKNLGMTVALAMVVLAVVVIAVLVIARKRQKFLDGVARGLAAAPPSRRRAVLFWGFLLACTACFSAQASILPSEYWSLYGNSPVRFLLAQGGNLLYALLVAEGLAEYLATRVSGRFVSASMSWFLLLTAASGMTAVLALLVTLQTVDDNWLLRVVNYTALFAAPFAALTLRKRYVDKPRTIALAVAAACVVSVLASVRWTGLIAC